jgi:hypothetical protein
LLIAIDDCGLSPIAGMVIGRSLLNRRLDNRQSTTVYTRSISNLHSVHSVVRPPKRARRPARSTAAPRM